MNTIQQCMNKTELEKIIATTELDEQMFTALLVKATALNCLPQFQEKFISYANRNIVHAFEALRGIILNQSQRIGRSRDDLYGLVKLMDFFLSEQMMIKFDQLEITNRDTLIAYYLSVPTLIRNLFQTYKGIENYEQTFYERTVEAILKADISKPTRTRLFEKLVLLGQNELLANEIYKRRFQLLLDDADACTFKVKLVTQLVLTHLINNDIQVDPQLLNAQLLVSIAVSPRLPPQRVAVLCQLIQKTCSTESLIQILRDVLIKWSDKEFPKFASKAIQYNTTNLIANLLSKSGLSYGPKLDTVVQLINDGIQSRFNYFQSFHWVRECALVVQKHFVRFLQLENNDLVDTPEEMQWNEDKEAIIQVEEPLINTPDPPIIPPEDDQFMTMDVDEPASEAAPKCIYDALTALQNQNKTRIELALKHLPYLIRKNLSDVVVYADQLGTLMLKISFEDFWEDAFEEHRKNVMVALLIIASKQTSDIVINRFFSDDSSLGDKHFILQVLMDSVDELSNNPQRYPVEQYDKYLPSQNQTFYFQKVSTKYCSKLIPNVVTEPQPKPKERQPQQRRWGHTKRAHEGLTRQDLIVSHYSNRFHSLLESLFYPLVIFTQSKLRLLMTREPLLLTHLLQMCTKMLDCAKHSFELYKMVDECVDLCQRLASKNIQVLQAKLQLWVKVSVLLKQNVLQEHPLLLEKIMKLLESFNTREMLAIHDARTKQMLAIIYENFKQLISIKL